MMIDDENDYFNYDDDNDNDHESEKRYLRILKHTSITERRCPTISAAYPIKKHVLRGANLHLICSNYAILIFLSILNSTNCAFHSFLVT